MAPRGQYFNSNFSKVKVTSVYLYLNDGAKVDDQAGLSKEMTYHFHQNGKIIKCKRLIVKLLAQLRFFRFL